MTDTQLEPHPTRERCSGCNRHEAYSIALPWVTGTYCPACFAWRIIIRDSKIDGYHPKEPSWWEGDTAAEYREAIPEVAETIRKYIPGWNMEDALARPVPKS